MFEVKKFNFPTYKEWEKTESTSCEIGNYVARIKVAGVRSFDKTSCKLVSGIVYPKNSADPLENAIFEHCYAYVPATTSEEELERMYNETCECINDKFSDHVFAEYIVGES